MTRHTHSSAAIEAFVFPSLPSPPFALFRAMYFTNARLSADVLFCPRRDAVRRDAKEIVSRPRDLFAKLRRIPPRKAAGNFAVYGELINAVCADEKMLFTKFTREFPRLD